MKQKRISTGDRFLDLIVKSPPFLIEAVCALVILFGYLYWPAVQICKQ